MGLDTYAVDSFDEKTGQYNVAEDVGFEKLQLCGGMFSGSGGSFRGKVYNDLIEELTDQTLYEEYIPPHKVKEMYDKLEAYRMSGKYESEQIISGINADPQGKVELLKEFDDLVEFFRVCATEGYGLAGWW